MTILDTALTWLYLLPGLQPAEWWLLMLATTASDAWTTMMILDRGGYEGNPALAWLMEKIGPLPALIVSKLPPLVVFMVWMQELVLYLPLAVILYSAMVVSNLRVLNRLRVQ